MLSQIQASYHRVEQSLQRLTDSIAAYHPSTSAADELVAGDDAVNYDLEQLVIHQRNYLRILELRKTTQSLDETIKNTIRQLAEARKDILAIPSNTSTTDVKREVKVDDLLSYAKFISKTTVPPTFRKPLPESLKSKPTNGDGPHTQIANGIVTPPVGAQESAEEEERVLENVAVKQLSEDNKMFLDPAKHLPFEPWPSFDVIQRGGLASIQKMVEEGKDPAEVMTAEEREEAERKKQEDEKREEEALERRRLAAIAAGGRRPTQNDVFDPDEA